MSCTSWVSVAIFSFLARVRIVDPQIEHETVQLCLGQWVRALLLDGILGRQHEERGVEVVGLAGCSDVALLHRFEEGCLRLRRGPVDLVGQDDVCEDRSPHEAEDPLAGELVLLDDLGAGDVGRHEVGGELDPVELQVQRLGERRDDQRLGESGHSDQEHVAVGHHGRQDTVDDVLLAHDAALHRRTKFLADFACPVEELNIAVGRLGRAAPSARGEDVGLIPVPGCDECLSE